jgi:tetratricopeptide (TPR) repeat protein
MEELKKIMLDQCRFEYENNPRELMKINDFDMHCSNENILNWYTKDSFLYRLLNKAFRTRNIDFICQFRYFLIGLYKKFQELSEIQKEIYPLTVYRGQTINTNELKRLQLNVEHFISVNTIMSTSRLENIARSFICDAPLSVLFKININDTTNCKFRPFIDISKFSSMPAEQEILFFVGTIFSIVSVQEENHSTWIIELTLNNQISEPIEDFICDFQKHIHDFKNKHYLFMKTDDFSMIQQYYYILTRKDFCLNNLPINMIYIYVAFIFSNLGCYEKAIELYKKYLLIGNISIDSPQSKVIHIIIGYLYYHFSDYNNAFIHYGIALSLLDDTNLLAIELYNHIGDVWNNMDNVDNAISCYQQALYIANQKNISSGSDIDQKINDLRLKTKNSLENSRYERQINNIDEHYRSIINPDNETHLKHYQSQLNDGHNLTLIQRIDVLYQIGICLMRKGDFLQALEIFLETKQMIIEKQLDDANNPTSIRCVDLSYQIGLCLMKKGDFSQALKSLLQAEQIIIKNPPLWERFPQLLSTLYDNIAILYFFLNHPLKGIITWKKSIDIRINFSYN